MTEIHHHHHHSQNIPGENFIERNWHPLAAMVYLLICLTDFVIMPIYYEKANAELSPEKIVQLAVMLKDSAAQIAAIQVLRTERTWQPLSLGQNGFLHMAFGAILGVGIWSRGKEQGAAAMNNLASQIQNTVSTQPGNNANAAVFSTNQTSNTFTQSSIDIPK